eukprot:CAMPEP_0201551044 /NCGR_PEP_ID=MMETSP0173_2-20130828/7287_1 /ASSEMBLY_ACC=CAM_ASM_000268 /TAXON_ID=218659 /ORGANISM="Vexillifera sp., Strain DIVA3 564/2" /LENGTH=257 /DNA_ID=CAMNT_0047961193 /DNA_START=259 /DNA_END=1029 /DNA_ORIENTATION=-
MRCLDQKLAKRAARAHFQLVPYITQHWSVFLDLASGQSAQSRQLIRTTSRQKVPSSQDIIGFITTSTDDGSTTTTRPSTGKTVTHSVSIDALPVETLTDDPLVQGVDLFLQHQVHKGFITSNENYTVTSDAVKDGGDDEINADESDASVKTWAMCWLHLVKHSMGDAFDAWVRQTDRDTLCDLIGLLTCTLQISLQSSNNAETKKRPNEWIAMRFAKVEAHWVAKDVTSLLLEEIERRSGSELELGSQLINGMIELI